MRALRKRHVVEKTGLTIQHLGRLEKAGEFPQRFQLGPKSVAWSEQEVDAWLQAKMQTRGPLPRPVGPVRRGWGRQDDWGNSRLSPADAPPTGECEGTAGRLPSRTNGRSDYIGLC